MARSKTKTLKELSTAWEPHTQVWVPLEALAAALLPGNPKDHDHGQMVSSFKEFGVIDIPSYNLATGHLIGGNGRTETAMSLKANGEGIPEGVREIDGSWCMPVWITKVPQEREMAAAIALNRTGELGGWHADLLTSELASIAASEWGLEGTGYDPEDLDRLIADLADLGGGNGAGNTAEDPGPQVDRAEELREKWGTELGQVWEMGRHRIVCGDCTDRAVVERVMGGEKAGAVVTDPPFNVGFDYKSEFNDSREPSEYGQWLWRALELCESMLEEPWIIFVWQAILTCRYWSEWIPRDFRIFANTKDFAQFRPTSIQFSWDPVIFWGSGPSNMDAVAGRRDYFLSQTSKYVREESPGHPCPRPLDVCEYIIGGLCEPGLVLDPFLGSGTSLVACERLGRLGRGIEIEPKYVSVALERLLGLGLSPQLVIRQ